MATTEAAVVGDETPTTRPHETPSGGTGLTKAPAAAEQVSDGRSRRDLQWYGLLALATIWLLDAVLQLQPFMFTKGSAGFSGMLNSLGQNASGWVAHSITWNASIVYHHAVLTNTLFALVQFVIAFGIIAKRTTKAALVLSVVWSLGVWWFGEGLGGILVGNGTPFGGGPGAVLIYALLAVLLWPREGKDEPFVAARSWGVFPAKVVWIVFWLGTGLLAVIGHARQSATVVGTLQALGSSQPGWLAGLDKGTERFFTHHASAGGWWLMAACLLLAVAVLLPGRITEVILAFGVAGALAIWMLTQNFGGILGGGATDPNAGPLWVLLILIYWPLDANRRAALRRREVAR